MSPAFLVPRRSSPWYLALGVTAADLLSAWQPKGAPSQAASYSPIAGTILSDLSTTSAPTWSAESGWTFDGIDQHLLAEALGLSNNISVVVRFSGAQQVTPNYVLGWRTTGEVERPFIGIALYSSGQDYIYAIVGNEIGGAGSVVVDKTITEGIAGITLDYLVIHADTFYSTNLPQYTFSETANLAIAALNNAGSLEQFFSGSIQALAIYSKTLSLAQLRTITAKMATL